MKQLLFTAKDANVRKGSLIAVLRVLGGSSVFSLRNICAPVLVLVLACSVLAAAVDVFAVMQAFEQMADDLPLWPNFQPAKVPVAIYDGTRTWLFHHPSPPPKFQPVAGHAGVVQAAGRAAEVTANTSAEIGGVMTATVMLETSTAHPRRQAALLMHEAFHVFQRQHHPDWAANEAELFLYPVEDPDLLYLRRMETEALRRALFGPGDQAACWTRTALDLRAQRFAQLGAKYVEYERRTELNEGLAQYVEDRAFQSARPDLLPAAGFAADAVRQRAYASGEVLALLLDHLVAPSGPPRMTWRDELDSGRAQWLDQLLARRLAGAKSCTFYAAEERQAKQRAAADVQKLRSDRERMLKDFQTRPGWRVVLEASQPMQPQGFDPMNVTVVARGLVLHRRFMKAGGQGVAVEVMNEPALTEAAGDHPLFSGYRRITVDGFPTEPTITQDKHSVTLAAGGLKGSFASAKVERDERARQITISF